MNKTKTKSCTKALVPPSMARLPWPVWASLAANAILFAAKLVCYITTGSYAVAASLVDSTVVRAMGV
jgi:hypothetical protein